MAISNINQADVLKTMMDIDCNVQSSTDGISALAKAAKAMLRLEAHSLITVAELLSQIQYWAEDIQNTVNSEAEKYGANYVGDDEDDALVRHLYSQQNDLCRKNHFNGRQI